MLTCIIFWEEEGKHCSNQSDKSYFYKEIRLFVNISNVLNYSVLISINFIVFFISLYSNRVFSILKKFLKAMEEL